MKDWFAQPCSVQVFQGSNEYVDKAKLNKTDKSQNKLVFKSCINVVFQSPSYFLHLLNMVALFILLLSHV